MPNDPFNRWSSILAGYVIAVLLTWAAISLVRIYLAGVPHG